MGRKKIPRWKQKRSFENRVEVSWGPPQWFFKAWRENVEGTLFLRSCRLFFVKNSSRCEIAKLIANLPKLKANHLPPMMDTEAIRRWQGMRRVPISGILAGGCWGEQLRQPAPSLSDLFGVVQSPNKCVIGLLQGILKKNYYLCCSFGVVCNTETVTLCKKSMNKVASEKEPIETLEGQSRWHLPALERWKQNLLDVVSFAVVPRNWWKFHLNSFHNLYGFQKKEGFKFIYQFPRIKISLHSPAIDLPHATFKIIKLLYITPRNLT